MHGNLREWCQDYHGGYIGGIVLEPQGPGTGSDRVMRGGSWYGRGDRDDFPWICRSASRIIYGSDYRWSYSIGFRAVLSPGQP